MSDAGETTVEAREAARWVEAAAFELFCSRQPDQGTEAIESERARRDAWVVLDAYFRAAKVVLAAEVERYEQVGWQWGDRLWELPAFLDDRTDLRPSDDGHTVRIRDTEGEVNHPCPCETSPCREAAMVVLRRDDEGKPKVWCDPCIADLVAALNNGGVPTVASCCGHGRQSSSIVLADGRELTVGRFTRFVSTSGGRGE